ncbi:MAG: LytR C-terminal domain-containing protein, partial [Acidimicrobiales bacterium]|nr:LytR C-terminal domain-containing protein [Acidimicrobiales bacterium]
YFNGYDYGSVEFASEPQDFQAIDQMLGVRPNTDTMTGATLPDPGSITVSVENGTGGDNQASETASALQALGYQISATSDADSQNQVAETLVEYKSKADEPAAERVARSLSGAVIMALEPKAGGADVTVVTGSDFSVNPPPQSTSTSTPSSGSSATTSTSTPSSGSSQPESSSSATASASSSSLAPATSSNPSLAPFDPRSCTSSGGEGS